MAAKTKQQAIAEVDHEMISPANCFITFVGTKEGWKPLHGTGCAHYVAHLLGIRTGLKGITACNEGYTLRVPTLIQNMFHVVKINDVAINDVWVNHARDHCGIVVAVQPAAPGQKFPKITISQCSSNRAAGRIGVNQQDWTQFFHAHGDFYRRR